MDKNKIMYAPEGELQDSIQASGILDISDLSRKEIKNLAKNAASWSGENGTFSWQDIASGQADVQGRFTRHEDLFKRKFNKQLKKNLHHTEQQQLLNAAKEGDPEAMGKYVASKRDDTAPYFIPVVAAPAVAALAGSGALGTIGQTIANPYVRTGLDVFGVGDFIYNNVTGNGIKKTFQKAREGDTWGAIGSGTVDALGLLSIVDLPFAVRAARQFQQLPKYKWVKDIGDDGLRWQSVNRMDIDNAYNSLVSRGIIDNNADAIVGAKLGDTSDLKIMIDDNTANIIKSTDDYFWRHPAEWDNADPSVKWFLNETGNKSPEQISDFINIHLNPTSPRYNSMKTALREFGIDDSFLRPYKSQIGRKAIVENSRAVEDALDFVKKGHIVKESTTPSGGYIFKYQSPKYKIDPNRPLSGSMLDEDVITMGWIKPGNRTLTSEGTFSVGQTAAHEGAHANLGYNSQPKWLTNTPDWNRITEQEKFRRIVEATPDSPKYHFSYSSVPESSKKLLTPTKSVNDHASELAEGFSDLWATKYGMHDLGISSAALDPVKKYNYLDLFRYKMTPTGMTDRFIMQRGGWWKGWKQQLDALNKVYRRGGKINDR